MPQSITKRTLLAGSVGNVLEWYDFGVYGFVAPILAVQFFPTGNTVTSLIAAFGVFAAGYMMRPVGALVIGHVGDRMGRKQALALSIALMAIPTGAMAILPTYESIGIAAAVLLTVLRLLQGLSVGGEYTGSAVFLTERTKAGRRGLIGSVSLAGATFGVLLASGVTALLASLISPDAFADWGWRLAFIPGPILGIVGYILRRQIQENQKPVSQQKKGSIPIMEALRHNGRDMLRVGGAAASLTVAFYITFVYLTTYLTDIVKNPRAEALDINTAALVLLAVLLPVAGAISDRIGRRPVMITGACGILLLAYPLFGFLHSGDATLELAGEFVLAILIAVYWGPQGAQMVEQFPRNVRYSSVSVAYSLPVGVFGGTAPLMATWLIDQTGSDMSPAFYLMGFAAFGIFVQIVTPETCNKEFD